MKFSSNVIISLCILLLALAAPAPGQSEINNRNYAPGEMLQPKVEQKWLYLGDGTDWTYSHHPHITFFKGRFFVIFSNGHEREDRAGQRIMLTTSRDFRTWTTPKPIAEPGIGDDGQIVALTAAGFHQYRGTLVAYVGQNQELDKRNTVLRYLTSRDGETWSPMKDLGIRMISNHGPQATSTGRLIIPSNIAFAYTDDPAGITGWKVSGLFPKSMPDFIDNPDTFKEVGRTLGWPALVCEGSFWETDDKVLHMGLRAVQPKNPNRMWLTESRDNGVTWSPQVELPNFTNSSAKFHFGRLPDKRFYYVGSPSARNPLILSTSRDGINFDRHFRLLDVDTEQKALGTGRDMKVAWGYPHTLVHDGFLYAVVSANKRGLTVVRVALADLKSK